MTRDVAGEAARWVDQAEQDLVDARLLAEHDRFATACFLSQQSAEKALKGVLYGAGADAVLGHSVRQLCDEVARLDTQVAPRCREWALLDQYYIPTRYPDALPGGIPAEAYTEAQAQAAIASADSVIAYARKRLASS